MARALTRRNVVLLAIIGGALLLIANTQTWVTASGLGETSAAQQVEIPGTDAAETVTAMALVTLAGAVALTIARKVLRYVIGVLLVAAGTFALISTGSVILNPGEAALTPLGEITGTTQHAQDYELGIAVWFALAGAVLVQIAGASVLFMGSRWKDAASSKKYDRKAAPAAVAEGDADPDEFDLWDGLSEGSDPTDRR